jgi:predicted DNA-binding transcriptional regulator YafY
MTTDTLPVPPLSGPPPGELPRTPVQITYRNYRGEVRPRRIMPIRLWYGVSEWHPTPQYFIDAVDCDKDAVRSFALYDILVWGKP